MSTAVSFFVYSRQHLISRCRATVRPLGCRNTDTAAVYLADMISQEAYRQKLLEGDDWSPAIDSLQEAGVWTDILETARKLP